MQCPGCQHDNPPDMRFCGQCGSPLATTCAACGAASSPDNRFCGQCGAPLSQAPQPATQHRTTSPDSYTPKHLAQKILISRGTLEGERKQVTVLFADLKGSLEMLADRDPEEAHELLDPVIVMDERHLWRLLREYVDSCNEDRVHTCLRDSPAGRKTERRQSSHAKIVGLSRVGGLHHRYTWREAA